MSLSRYAKDADRLLEKPEGIECEQYCRVDLRSKRCRFYLPRGMCLEGVGSGGSCIEWTKVNPEATPQHAPADDASPEKNEPVDELDALLEDEADKQTPTSPSGRPPSSHLFTAEDIERFTLNGLEYRFVSKTDAVTDIWLVPEYSNEPGRREITPEHLNQITCLANAFDGAQVVGFRSLQGTRSPDTKEVNEE